MNKYLKKSDAIKVTNQHIEVYMEAIAMANDIKSVIRRYDGKKITKRIENDLRAEVNQNLRTENNPYGFTITYYSPNKCVDTERGAVYLTCSQLYMGGISKGELDDGRMDANMMLDSLNKQQAYMVSQVEKIEQDLSAIDKLIEERDDLVRRVRRFNENVTSAVREYFDLSIDLRG